jgi:lipopolysaccharide/colanic/teichoic acid biosynthesis glycosyltransferase
MFRIIIYRIFLIILCIIVAPFAAVITIAIVLFSRMPILFRQQRIGKSGKPFTMYKFRTMRVGAENMQKAYQKLNEADGPVFKIRNDPRFTRLGKFLAHTGLDELPQLVNVLCGDMALIGPRPLPVDEARKLTPAQKKRHDIKPGIISPWILDGYHKQTFDAWMKSDIGYGKKKSFLYDITLSFRTIIFLASLFIREISSC